MKCTHTALTVRSGPGEIVIEDGDSFEICFTEDGFLTLYFEGHDGGGGIVFGPDDVKRLTGVLNTHPKDIQ